MRVIISGARGQLGRQLETAFADHEILGVDLPDMDITRPAASEDLARFRPDLIVHAAALTNVDGCEQDPDAAYRVNALGTQNVALAAQRARAALVYISTNEVFDGSQRTAYREWDPINPISVYARTKAAGEQIVRDLLGHFYIVRIAWLFGPGGVNFITKILEGAEQRGQLEVAADEFGNPTYAPDLAQAIRELAVTGQYGIYHLTNAGFCSRYEFAREIMRLAGRPDLPITPILSATWTRPSRPPLHSILANTTAAGLGIQMRPWQEALADYMAGLSKP